MSSKFSQYDEYGFIRPDNFNFTQYEQFMSGYLGVLSKRGQKWEALVKDGYSKLNKNAKLKRYVRKGIPSSHRKGVWMEVSGAAKLRKVDPDLYTKMLNMDMKSREMEDQIKTDIPRTFPNNINFDKTSSTNYQTQLYNILKAFANNNPSISYCQGMNYIAGLLYLVTKDEDSSFWLLKVLCENILPDYYTVSMPGLLTDIKVLSELAKQEVPAVASHVDSLQMPWMLICSKWFICIYCEVLPVETVLRIWDTVFFEGSKILFRVAIGLLKLNKERLLAQKDFAALIEEFKYIVDSSQVINCHQFLEDICNKTGPMPRAKIEKLRDEIGAEVRKEQEERERRRRDDGSGIKDG